LGSTLKTTGNSTIGGTLTVSGLSELSTLNATGATTLGSTLKTTGNSTIGGTLTVSGLSELSTLNATGATTLGSTLTVSGLTNINNTTTASSGTGSLVINGVVYIDKNLLINESLAIGDNLDSSAIVDISSTTKGFVPPRMTTLQRNSISTPVNGLTIYNTDLNNLNVYNGTFWNPYINITNTYNPNSILTIPIWTNQTPAQDNQWWDIAWAPEIPLLVAVAADGVNPIMTSTDGIVWTSRTAISTATGIAWSSELTLFVVTGGSGVQTSPDGITWTSRTPANANAWWVVVWSSELGLFVSTAISGTNNRVQTSPDGINWTIRTTPEDNSWLG
jgi:hypothetical protein